MKMNLIYKKLKQFIKVFFIKNSVIMVDIDEKNYNKLEKLKKLFHFLKNIQYLEVFETKKGFHFYVYLYKEISFFKIILILIYLGADKDYILNCIRKGKMTLFYSRRGVYNEKFKYRLKRLYI